MKYRTDAFGISGSGSLTETLFRTRVCSAQNVITPSILRHSLSENWGLAARHPVAKNAYVGLLCLWILKSQPQSVGTRELHSLDGASSFQLTAKPPNLHLHASHCSLGGKVALHNP